jgi:hypothetical protein
VRSLLHFNYALVCLHVEKIQTHWVHYQLRQILTAQWPFWHNVLPADLGQLTLKKWWFPHIILSPWCRGILSVTGRPLTYDRAFERGSMNSPPSSIVITQCSGWIPSPESWISCSIGASRPPTKVRSWTRTKQSRSESMLWKWNIKRFLLVGFLLSGYKLHCKHFDELYKKENSIINQYQHHQLL